MWETLSAAVQFGCLCSLERDFPLGSVTESGAQSVTFNVRKH